jgi:PAS domain S-box-containing protein
MMKFAKRLLTDGRENRLWRILAILSLVVIVSTMYTLFDLARANSEFDPWHIHWFAVSCLASAYIFVMIYYVKAQRDRARRASEERYRSIIAMSSMGAWEFHVKTGYLWCSPEYFQMLGYDEQSFRDEYEVTIETVWINMLHHEDRDTAVEKFAAFVSGRCGNFYENTFRLRHRTGDWIWILSRSKALSKPDGGSSEVILGSHIDITEKILTQLELRKRNEKLMSFAFSNAHHIRGPVARMLGLVRLVRIDNEIDPEWYVQTICKEVHELDKITKTIARELDDINDTPNTW